MGDEDFDGEMCRVCLSFFEKMPARIGILGWRGKKARDGLSRFHCIGQAEFQQASATVEKRDDNKGGGMRVVRRRLTASRRGKERAREVQAENAVSDTGEWLLLLLPPLLPLLPPLVALRQDLGVEVGSQGDGRDQVAGVGASKYMKRVGERARC